MTFGVTFGDRMLSVREVAGPLGFHEDAIRRAVRRGELRATKVCGRLRIAPDDLQAWLQAGETAAAASVDASSAAAKSEPRNPARRTSGAQQPSFRELAKQRRTA